MSDPVETPSKTPNQPAVETPAAAASTPVAANAPVTPTVAKPAAETPAAPAASVETAPTPEAKAASDKAAADAAAAAAAKPAEVKPPPTEAEAAAAKATADAEAAKAAATAVPETYEIQIPKAFQDQGLALNPDVIPALTPALKKAGLTQSQLQTVAEAFIEFQTKVPARQLERDLEVTMKDPDVGGLNYGRTQGHVNAALSAFTHPEFRSLLAKTGLANNLEFVRVFERIGKAMSGDAPARGTPDGAPQLSRSERLYGKTTPTT